MSTRVTECVNYLISPGDAMDDACYQTRVIKCPAKMFIVHLIVDYLQYKTRNVTETEVDFLMKRFERFEKDQFDNEGNLVQKQTIFNDGEDIFIAVDSISWFMQFIKSMHNMIHAMGELYLQQDYDGNYLVKSIDFTSSAADKQLDVAENGTFIVRFSQSTASKMALASKYEGVVSHYQITYNGDSWSILEKSKAQPEQYPALNELLEKTNILLWFSPAFPKDRMIPSPDRLAKIAVAAAAVEATNP